MRTKLLYLLSQNFNKRRIKFEKFDILDVEKFIEKVVQPV